MITCLLCHGQYRILKKSHSFRLSDAVTVWAVFFTCADSHCYRPREYVLAEYPGLAGAVFGHLPGAFDSFSVRACVYLVNRVCVVYWSSIQYPPFRRVYANRSRVIVSDALSFSRGRAQAETQRMQTQVADLTGALTQVCSREKHDSMH